MSTVQQQAKDDNKSINSVNINANRKREIGSMSGVTFSLIEYQERGIESDEFYHLETNIKTVV